MGGGRGIWGRRYCWDNWYKWLLSTRRLSTFDKSQHKKSIRLLMTCNRKPWNIYAALIRLWSGTKLQPSDSQWNAGNWMKSFETDWSALLLDLEFCNIYIFISSTKWSQATFDTKLVIGHWFEILALVCNLGLGDSTFYHNTTPFNVKWYKKVSARLTFKDSRPCTVKKTSQECETALTSQC